MTKNQGSVLTGTSDARYSPWAKLAVAAIPVALVFLGLRSAGVEVEVATVQRGPLREIIRAEGQAKVRHRYVVSAPFDGKLLRPSLQIGDRVVAGETVVAELTPHVPTPLDPRSRAEAEASVQRALAELGSARVEADRAEAARRYAAQVLERASRLVASGILAASDHETAVLSLEVAEKATNAARFAEHTAESELARAKARLRRRPQPLDRRDVSSMRSPVDGVVLALTRQSEAMVRRGEPLLELGDASELEIVAELVTREAVVLAAGQPARVLDWGGAALEAVVRLVEPQAITKTSVLGVQEQRVAVHLDLLPAQPIERLADGYRVVAEIEVWRSPQELSVPLASLFRSTPAAEWQVLVVLSGGALAQRSLSLGRSGQGLGGRAQVLGGLVEGERVVLYPEAELTTGRSVRVRGAPRSASGSGAAFLGAAR